MPFYKGDTMKMVPLNSWQDYERMPETAWKIKQPEDGETRLDALSLGTCNKYECFCMFVFMNRYCILRLGEFQIIFDNPINRIPMFFTLALFELCGTC